MGAVWMRVRAEWRERRRVWIALALAFGIVGRLTMAAAAGARRTYTAYPRFLESHLGEHIVTGGVGDPDEADAQREALVSLPQVEEYAFWQFVSDGFVLPSGVEVTFPEGVVGGDQTGRHLTVVNRPRFVDGVPFDPAEAGEAIVDTLSAERHGIGVGDEIQILLYDPETFERTITRSVTIVGVAVIPGRLPAVGATSITGVEVSPAFIEENLAYMDANTDGPIVRAQIASFKDDARALVPFLDFPAEQPRHVEGVRKTLRFDVGALWILSLLLGLAGSAILGQAVARHIAGEAPSQEPLRALGMGVHGLLAVDLARATLIGVAASAVSVLIAIVASPLTPVGLARQVEPSPGVSVDPLVLLIGAAATFAVPLLVSVIPAVRAARQRVRIARVSTVASVLAASGAGPDLVAGTRLALESGRGERSVPVRAAIGGIALALAAFAAAGSFTASLQHLAASPELYGFTWDVLMGGEDTEAEEAWLAGDPDIEAYTRGGYANVEINDLQLIPAVYEPGSIEPTILEGRAPRTAEEIALGGSLMRSLGIWVGDQIEVSPSERGRDGPTDPKPYTVVGRTVVPSVFFQQVEPGQSSAMTLDGVIRLDPREDPGFYPLLVRFRDGVDLRAKVQDIKTAMPTAFVGQIREAGADLAALQRATGVPQALTGLLLVMAIGTLVHALTSAVRRRRRDLAILKTLGFVRRQVRAAVAWQSTILAGFAIVIGVPLGVAAGRLAWRWFAESLGVVPVPVSPLIVALLIVPLATVAISNVVASVPARAAARTQPAIVFRGE